jgi:hypothetical protein
VPCGLRQVVSTRIPVSATMSSTMEARIAMAVRPKSDELLEGAGVAVDAFESADTVGVRRFEFELAGYAKPLPCPEGVLHGKSIDATKRPERDSIPARNSDQGFSIAHPVSGDPGV